MTVGEGVKCKWTNMGILFLRTESRLIFDFREKGEIKILMPKRVVGALARTTPRGDLRAKNI